MGQFPTRPARHDGMVGMLQTQNWMLSGKNPSGNLYNIAMENSSFLLILIATLQHALQMGHFQ